MTSRKPDPAAQGSAPQEPDQTHREVYWTPPVPENGTLADDTSLAFTRFSTDGDYLTKSFTFVEGKLIKESHATLRSATAETIHVRGLVEFAQCLDGLEPTQAVAFGVMFGRASARVVVESKRKRSRGTVARTRQFFQFAPRPGILMFDHDGTVDGNPIAPEELRDRLVAAVPILENTSMLWRPSASSGLIGPEGQPVAGGCGQRLYVAVADASLIVAAGKAIWDLLWAAGEGGAVVGSAGQKLQRSIVDASVWQPERLDFAAAPIVAPPLSRQPTPWRILGEGSDLCDLREVIRLADGSIQRRAKKARDSALRAVDLESQEKRNRWLDAKAPALAKAREIPVEEAREVLGRASATGTLLGHFELLCEDGSRVTVADLLSDRDRWHGARFADPIEPEYRGDQRIAYADLKSGGPPFLWSHAHGGCRYKLARELHAILVREGERPRIVDDCLEVLRSAGEVFELGRGGALVRVVAGRIVPVSSDWLLDHLQRSARFEREAIQQGIPVRYPVDLKPEIAHAILAKSGERGLPALAAVVTAPTLRQDGGLLVESGYDEASRLLQLREHPEAAMPILSDASPDQAVEALGELWSPFLLFPFVDDVDRGTYLAALLTACVRASLPAAPGFALDAPTAGTGKTLLARVLGALATGEAPPILSPVPSKNEEETRKRLFALVREGERIVIWDNVYEPVGNPALDSFLTAPTYTDRVLGVSEMASLPNRALFVVTGNNVRFVGDTCRRILKARLDARMERPYARRFSFCPLQYTLANRQRMVANSLTILRAYITAGRPRPAGGSVASFEDWDDLVRQAVVWIGQVARQRGGPEAPGFADPMQSVDKSFELDAETGKLSALLTAWHDVLGDKRVVVSDLVAEVEDPVQRPDAGDLLDALDDIAGERGRLNRRILGRWLERNVDRAIGGFCLRRGPHRGGRVTWRVVRLARDGEQPVDENKRDDEAPPTQKALF